MVEAILDNEHLVKSQVINVNAKQSKIDQDLEWIIKKSNLDHLQTNNSQIKVNVYKLGDDGSQLVGFTTIALDQAIPALSNLSDSRRESGFANWKTLTVDKPSSTTPSILCTLFIEESQNDRISCNYPMLRPELGYFVLGNEDEATDIFYFNVFVGCVMQVFPVSFKRIVTEVGALNNYFFFSRFKTKNVTFRTICSVVKSLRTISVIPTNSAQKLPPSKFIQTFKRSSSFSETLNVKPPSRFNCVQPKLKWLSVDLKPISPQL